MKFHEMEQTDLVEATNTSMKQGLTEKEVKKRLETHGPNELQEGKKHQRLFCFSHSLRILWCLCCLRRLSFPVFWANM